MIVDSNLTFDKQINNVVKTSFFHLRLITKVKPFLCFRDFEKATHGFISSRLDFCNSLYSGVTSSSIGQLQLVQNAAVGTHKRDHISSILASLHWLPVSFRIDFKILTLVFKTLHKLAPTHLADLLTWYSPPRFLRSADQMLLVVHRSRIKHRGHRAFAVTAPKLWNTLPLHIRSSPTLDTFKSHLKTHFYSLAFDSS